MNNAYFNHIQEKITPILRKARHEILIAMAWFTNEELMDELIACVGRRVKVSLILLDHPTNWMPYAPDFNKFIDAGGFFYVADLSVGFMHHKFCVVDNEVLITGSYNWTHYAEIRNVENIVVSDDKELCQKYKDEFSRLTDALNRVSKCQRITWEEVAEYTNVNFDEISYEVKAISKRLNLPCIELHPIPKKVSRVVLPVKDTISQNGATTVQLIDSKKTYKASRDLGILTDEEKWSPLICKGEKLPAVHETEFYLDNRHPEECECILCEWNSDKKKGKVILSKSLSEIAHSSKTNSKVKLEIGLEDDGYMYFNIKNNDNGLTIKGKHYNEEFVYAE